MFINKLISWRNLETKIDVVVLDAVREWALLSAGASWLEQIFGEWFRSRD